ncbi:MAG: NADH-quinone oxidoreductase subunit L [Deltaproteobacteria bacterium]|nr:NADH-quinone oxidoreductase subunit L [Deltaproteobacteria bacterium]
MEAQAYQLGLIPLFPLIGSLLAFVIGRRAKDLAGWIATGASALSFAVVVNLVLSGTEEALTFIPFTWFSVFDFSIDFSLRFDHLTAVMCLVVTGIGSLIHLYSIGYMAEDEGRHRFFSYLNLFMFSMLLLVLGGNLLVLFVGWEGVGLCSYLLIGFWFKNLSYAAAGRKAFVVNRIGDAGFLLGIFFLYRQFATIDFVELAQAISANPEQTTLYTVIAFCLFVGATGKSAQIPLFTWLPDAMAGPTPVSALIHAATMVTAGVYMMARLNFLFDLAPYALFVVSLVAVATAFIAATTAITQNDIKKVLAYSTVSQLGFMFMAVGAGAYWVAVFHLVTHAFFKACLFLGAGSVIHGCHHEQDMRHMGGLAKYMPVTCLTYGISTLAIAGIFPLAGYYSKHAILEALAHNHNVYLVSATHFLGAVASFTAFITAFYMTRSFAMTFLGEYRGHAHPHESPWKMTLPLIVLAALALGGGIWLVTALPEFLSTVLPNIHEHESASLVENILASWVGILGVLVGLIFYTKLLSVPGQIFNAVLPLSKLSLNKYYFDEIYAAMVVRPLESISGLLFRVVDQSIVDGAVNGTGAIVELSGEVARTSQTGQVRQYALFMFIATLVVALFCFVL